VYYSQQSLLATNRVWIDLIKKLHSSAWKLSEDNRSFIGLTERSSQNKSLAWVNSTMASSEEILQKNALSGSAPVPKEVDWEKFLASNNFSDDSSSESGDSDASEAKPGQPNCFTDGKGILWVRSDLYYQEEGATRTTKKFNGAMYHSAGGKPAGTSAPPLTDNEAARQKRIRDALDYYHHEDHVAELEEVSNRAEFLDLALEEYLGKTQEELDVLEGELQASQAVLEGKLPPTDKKGKGVALPSASTPAPLKETKLVKHVSFSGKEVPPQPKQSAVEKDNPLNVKGTPKSKALSEEQRKALRAYFKLETEPIPQDEFAKLSKKEKTKALKSRSIPRWASEAVLRKASNLQEILEGRLTKDNFQKSPRIAPPNQSSRASQAMEAWLALKADYRGIPLLRRPSTAREKAFKERFLKLKEQYGEQACFPRFKERPDHQGQAGSPARARGNNPDMGGFLDMAKAFGEIARALRGN
jgi:putative sterol carrier protein